MEDGTAKHQSEVASSDRDGRTPVAPLWLARGSAVARTANNHAAGRACNDRRIAFGPMHFFAAPARAPRRHGSDARASHPIRARRPGDRRPTLRSGIRNSYASTHAGMRMYATDGVFQGGGSRTMDVRRTTRSFGHRHRPPVLTGFTWAVNGEFPTLRSQLPQISRKCAHFDARRYVRGSVREFF